MNRDLRLLLSLLAPCKGRYALGALGLAASDLGQLATFHLVGRAIDALAGRGASAAVLWRFALAILGCALVTAVARYVWRIYVQGSARLIEARLRERLVAHLQTLSADFYLKRKVGELMAHATNDVQAVRGVAGEGVMAGVDAVLMGVGAAVMMILTVDARLAAYALAPLVLLPVVTYFLGVATHRRYGEVQAAFATLSDRVAETIAGIRVVKGFAAEAQRGARFSAANDGYRTRYRRMLAYNVAFDPVINLFSGLAFATGLLVGGAMVLDGAITLGQYVAFNSYLGMLVWPMLAVGWVMNLTQRALASVARLQVLFETAPAVLEAEDAVALPAPHGRLSIRDLRFAYAEGAPPALDGLSIELAPGRTLGILGGTGSGKTTLANLLVRVFDPPAGTVFLDGVDVRRLRLGDLRRAIAYVPQDPFLFSVSIRENVAFHPGAHDPARIEEAVRVACLDADLSRFPDGLDTLLGERGVTLSGGQRQRVGIARAVFKGAPLLVLDDCLSAVDTQTEGQLLARLRPLMAERATVVVAHRVSAVRHADEIILLEAGRVVERGDHATLLALGGRYAELYRRQRLEAALETGAFTVAQEGPAHG